ncbi:glycoside hydrolase family 127 protein [Clostridium coskatii]|nr:beta-L-arabinofuranosidase domain-containing protein [Clostridium coskatii]
MSDSKRSVEKMQTCTNLELNNVKITSEFWNRYRELIVKEVLPYQWSVMNDEANIHIADDPQKNGTTKNSHAIANLKIVAGKIKGHHSGFPFQDTDVYKWLEAVAYSLRYHPNDDLKQITDKLIDLIAEAQEYDGYLSTYFQIEAPERKFKRLKQSHELYTMGHYIEAAVAYYQVTGNEKALNIARKMADCIDNNFGLEKEKIPGYDGHPEIELALSRLYELTHEKKYLNLAYYFLKQRGQDPKFFDHQIEQDGFDHDLIEGMRNFPLSYYQAAEPIVDQETAEGHAVRVVYLCTGIAYVARLTGDQDLLTVCKRFWNNIVKKRMYVTGNIGSTTTGESFTYDYDLPNDTMYGETCASVGMTFFAKQMLQIEPEGEYGDILEKELFNGSLSGISLDGKHFFYVNPLEADPTASKGNPGKSHILTRRADWFGCACCPSNVARLIASVDQYIYTVHGSTILSHQFISNEANFDNNISIIQSNNFPWDGNISYKIKNPGENKFKFGIRIPSWSQCNYKLQVNKKNVNLPVKSGFVYIFVESSQMQIDLSLDMCIQFIRANNRVKNDLGKVAVQRGPIVYCAEEMDNSASLWLYRIKEQAHARYHYNDHLLNGIGTIEVDAEVLNEDSKDDLLYTTVSNKPYDWHESKLSLIPYYAWGNRDDGQMAVWLNKEY